jgi:hypothetical protein
MRLIEDWVELHKNELLEYWNESLNENPNFKKIEPFGNEIFIIIRKSRLLSVFFLLIALNTK